MISCIIPARAGSKGIPNKNMREFNGTPLIVHGIRKCLRINEISHIYVTSDCPKILDLAAQQSHRVLPHKRPSAISTDTSKTEDAVFDLCINQEVDEWILLYQLTSPFMQPDEISSAIKMTSEYDTIISAVNLHSFPWKNNKPLAWDPQFRPRRQDHNGIYIETGSFYLFQKARFIKSQSRINGKVGFVSTSLINLVELDTPSDWELAERLASLELACTFE